MITPEEGDDDGGGEGVGVEDSDGLLCRFRSSTLALVSSLMVMIVSTSVPRVRMLIYAADGVYGNQALIAT